MSIHFYSYIAVWDRRSTYPQKTQCHFTRFTKGWELLCQITAHLKSTQCVYFFPNPLKANKYCNFTAVADSSEGNRYKKNYGF